MKVLPELLNGMAYHVNFSDHSTTLVVPETALKPAAPAEVAKMNSSNSDHDNT